MIKQLLKVNSNKEIADKIYELKLAGNFNLDEFTPGRFIHIKCGSGLDPLLRRPMSICDIDDSGSEMVVLYRNQGKGTKILAEMSSGDELDLLAPLGLGFKTKVEAGKTAVMVGGGIGVPPLYYLARKLKAKGVKIKTLLGFNSAKDVFYEKEFAELGDVQVSTIDASHGHGGFVTELLDEDWDLLYSCGPNPMLHALQKIVPKDKEAYISLEERMGCGVGACLACVCKPSESYKSESGYLRACTEGPVFGINDIRFEN